MGDSTKKIVTMGFVVAGVLSFVVINVLFETLAASFGWAARVHNIFWVKHFLPVVIGVGVFAALQLNAQVVEWAGEVVSEISKVVWPTRQQTVGMTIVVCIMVVISGLILGTLDILSGQLINVGILRLRDLF